MTEPCKERTQKRELLIREVYDADKDSDSSKKSRTLHLTFPNKTICKVWYVLLA